MKFIVPKKILLRTIIFSFLAIYGISYGGAYILTHYRSTTNTNGLGMPRPIITRSPKDINLKYTNKIIPINQLEWLDTWLIKANNNSQGTVILFHGKGSTKSSLLTSAKEFHLLGYDTLLVDFRGSGGSSGNKTTIGVEEAEDVVLVFNYISKSNSRKPIILYGLSMGSAAILRAIAKYNINPDRIILELPFARLLSATKKRLKNYSLPTFPLGELFIFWGGIQHGFNGFTHNPVDDAKLVTCPTLILSGKQDKTVDILEVEELSNYLDVEKNMVVFPEAGHQLLVTANRELWLKTIRDFLN